MNTVTTTDHGTTDARPTITSRLEGISTRLGDHRVFLEGIAARTTVPTPQTESDREPSDGSTIEGIIGMIEGFLSEAMSTAQRIDSAL